MNNVYSEYADSVIRNDCRKVMPISDLNFNSPNNLTEFKIDHGDSFYDGRIMYHITGKVVKKSDDSAYAAASTIQLVDNFVPFLFSRIEVRKHNTLIDSVEHPGITSTVKGLISYSKSQKHTLDSCGFVSKFSGGGRFEAHGSLGHLGLGFFDHLLYPMFKGGFEITFTRAQDNDALYRWNANTVGSTEPSDGKVIIESFVLRVPLVEYAATSKIKLIDSLKNLSDSENLIYKYFQWQCINKKGVKGSNFSFDITNLYRNVDNPKFIIVGLQTGRSDNQNKDTSKFDNCNIKNTVVKINGENYPQEPQDISISSNKYMILYDMYQNFRRKSFGDDNVYLESSEFVNSYPLIVIDTSLYPNTDMRVRNDIQINMDFTTPVTSEDTVAYVVVISKMVFTYNITKNIIKMQ